MKSLHIICSFEVEAVSLHHFPDGSSSSSEWRGVNRGCFLPAGVVEGVVVLWAAGRAAVLRLTAVDV